MSDFVKTQYLDTFDQAYKAYSKLVYTVAFHILFSSVEAEEVVQEVFIRYAKNASSIENIKSWLIRSTMNFCINEYHRRKRFYSYLDQTIHKIKTLFSTISSNIATNQELDMVLRSLDERERCIIILKLGYDYKYDEISKMLNIKEGTVKSSLSRILKKIQSQG